VFGQGVRVTSASNVSLLFKIKVGKARRLTMISNVCDRFLRILGSEDFFIPCHRAHDIALTVNQISGIGRCTRIAEGAVRVFKFHVKDCAKISETVRLIPGIAPPHTGNEPHCKSGKSPDRYRRSSQIQVSVGLFWRNA
jgi:hypothetical protein